MSFLGGGKAAGYKPNYTGLQVQTSVNTLPVPVLWGRARLAPNVIWYNNFQQHSQKQKGGKGLGGSSSTYTYSADVILAMCEGPISSIAQIWLGTTIYTSLSAIGLGLFTGANPQAGWSYLYSKYPTQALSYPGIAYVCAGNYNLGSSASLPGHNFEVVGCLAGTGANGVDADPALVIEDALFSTQYGVQYPQASVNLTSLLSSSTASTTGDAALQTYCRAVGLAISPCLTSIETFQSVLQRWQKLLNVGIVDSGGVLNFVPYGDSTVTGNGVTWVPNLTPIFNLDDDDFLGDSSADPVQLQITDPTEAKNIVRITIKDRANAYNSAPIDARDEASVNQYGIRVDTSVSADEICDVNVAAISAQLILQRLLYVRNTLTFKLDARYCGMDPMDVVTVTDTALGMSNTLVRITAIEEDDQGELTITAEEMPTGIGTAVAYPKQSASGTGISTAFTTASPVNPPIIFEPPASLSGGASQIWIGASGAIGGVADPLWGGAEVYLSLDNTTYTYVGNITAPVRQGALMAALPSYVGSNPDSTDTLSVDLTQSGGTLSSATSAAAAADGATACYVDGEVVSFTTATLTNSEQYALTGLYRGQDNTAAAAHAAGTQFARLDDAFFEYDLPAVYIGQTVYVKLASFNGQGGGLQDLSDCVAYSYVPMGAGLFGPVASALAIGTALDYGMVSDSISMTDDFGVVQDTSNTPIELGATLT